MARHLRYFDFECDVCGRQTDELVRGEDEYPTCCGQVMRKIVGKVNYHMNMEDHERAHRPSGIDWKADPLTKKCVEEGLRRRRERLGGTGKL
jgi:hypothetical protein